MAEQHTPRVLILASGDPETGGGGSTAEYLLRGVHVGQIPIEVGAIVCNNSRDRVPGLYDRIDALNTEFNADTPVLKINGSTHKPTESESWELGDQTLAESEAIYKIAEDDNYDLVLLLGYMKRIRGALLERYGSWPQHGSIYDSAMLNFHHGPLPETQGKYGIHIDEEVLRLGLPYSSVTIHAVTEEYDAGAVYRVKPALVLPGATPKTLSDTMQIIEKAELLTTVPDFLQEQREYRQAP